jgi:hypothetical protein
MRFAHRKQDGHNEVAVAANEREGSTWAARFCGAATARPTLLRGGMVDKGIQSEVEKRFFRNTKDRQKDHHKWWCCGAMCKKDRVEVGEV